MGVEAGSSWPEDQIGRRSVLRGLGGLAATGVLTRGVVAGSALTFAGAVPAVADSGKHAGGGASRHGPDVVLEWFRTLYSGFMDEGTTPAATARLYACAAVAGYEAVVPGAAGLRSLAGQVNGLSPLPAAPSHAVLDWPAVASVAIATTMGELLVSASAGLRGQVEDQLQTHLEQRRSSGVPVPVLRRSVLHGRHVGDHVAAWAETDGAAGTIGRAYSPPVGPGLWRSTPPNFGTAIDPHWGSVRPMTLPSADACAPPPPPATFSTDPASAFWAQAQATLQASDTLDDEGRAIALFWRDNPITSGLPAGHWMLLTGQVVGERGLMLDRTAEAHALVAIVLADAFTSCWHEKYVTNLVRPVSYIRDHVPGRADWLSFVNTPQFPEYTSGHSVASEAAAHMLTATLGTFPFTDRTHALRNPGLGSRSFASFAAAADEAAWSRLKGGIHYPMGIEVGREQGVKVGQVVRSRITTREPTRR